MVWVGYSKSLLTLIIGNLDSRFWGWKYFRLIFLSAMSLPLALLRILILTKTSIPFIFKYHVNFFNFLVLIDHDVPEENITLVSLLMAVNGVNTIAYAFKNVKIVTSEVDPSINDAFQIVPGFGNFADRYFGTEPNRM